MREAFIVILFSLRDIQRHGLVRALHHRPLVGAVAPAFSLSPSHPVSLQWNLQDGFCWYIAPIS